MILRTPHGNRTLFGAFDSSTPIPRPSQWGVSVSSGGRRVDTASATGLPAFMRGIRLIAETTAGMPFRVKRGDAPASDAPQLGVLRRPNEECSAFQAWSFAVASMVLDRGAYLWKVKVRGKVEALYPLNPAQVMPKREGGEIVFMVREGQSKVRYTRSEIIYIPGVLLDDPYIGVSLVAAFRHALGSYLDRQEFEARFLANDGSPGIVLTHPDSPHKTQRDQIRESFEARHVGSKNAGRPAFMWGGWQLERLEASMEDAQFIESQRFSVQEVGRMLGIPSGLLGDPESPGNQTPEQENMRFLTYGLDPWMTRLEQGLAADRDLFPEPDWSVELDPSKLLRADIKTRYEAYRLARQGGWITANEIREDEGRDPREGGDEIQITPVGGAENPGLS